MIRLAIAPSRDGRRHAVAAALFAGGVDSLEESGRELVVYAANRAAADFLAARVLAVDPSATTSQDEVPLVDWSRAWRDRFSPQRVGALTVVPTWMSEGRDAQSTIVIEPAMAFGTGDHATTRGVLVLLQRAVHPGDFVADLGAGSAILAIASVKLGAARAAAVELDPAAIPNAEENVAANGVGNRVSVIEGDATVLLPLLAPVDVVLANIISSVIRDLLPVISRSLAPGGRAIFSGMLIDERDAMLAEFRHSGFTAVAEDAEGEWWSALTERASR